MQNSRSISLLPEPERYETDKILDIILLLLVDFFYMCMNTSMFDDKVCQSFTIDIFGDTCCFKAFMWLINLCFI